VEQRGEDTGGVESALVGGAEHGGEHLLGTRAARAAIAATDLARDDGGADRLLGSPVGRVDVGIAEKREERLGLDRQMGDEALDGGERRPRGCEEIEDLGEEAAARDREAVGRHRPRHMAVPQGERLLKPRLQARREWAARMIGAQRTTPPQEMRETRLVMRACEASVRNWPLTFQPVSSGLTIGLPRTWAQSRS
jgi:hypothetical protein